MKQYTELLEKILKEGETIDTERTGVGTIAIFGEQIKFDLRDGFPAVTTKKLAWKAVVSELIWFLKGSDNVHELRSILHGVENEFNLDKKTIWDANYNSQGKFLNYDHGFMGDIYGVQWRQFGKCTHIVRENDCELVTYGKSEGVDQVKVVLEEAAKNPSSRRLLINAWNPKVIWDDVEDDFKMNKAVLPPCHVMFQLRIVNGHLDLMFTMRSNDVFLGGPFNIASYALLLHIFARILGLLPRTLVMTIGDAHIYNNHVDQVKEQLSRSHLKKPNIWINPNLKTLEDFENASVDDFKLIDYVYHPTIKAPMVV